MAALFQLVLFVVAAARDTWGNAGVLVSGAVFGLTDVDALTISMARGARAGVPVDVAARAVAIGVLTNTAVKLGIALAVGRGTFRRLVGPSLAALAVVLGVLVGVM